MKAGGHINIEVVYLTNPNGVPVRMYRWTDPKAREIRRDEYRHFKRHGMTHAEAALIRADFMDSVPIHKQTVVENNERMAMIAAARGKSNEKDVTA